MWPERCTLSKYMSVRLGSLVLVSGDTYQHRDKIKDIGGGTWCKPLTGWIFPESQRTDVQVALASLCGSTSAGSTSAEKPAEADLGEEAEEGDETGKTGTGGMPSPAAPSSIAPSSNAASPSVAPTGATSAASPSRNAGAALTLVKHKRAIVVKGDTFKVKEQLGALKGSWNRTLGGWVFQGSRKDEILSLLRADGTNVVSDETGGAAPSSPAKRPRADSSEPGQAAEAERDWDAEYKKGRDKLGQEHGFNNFDDFVDDYIVRARKRQEKKADRTAILMSGACMYGVGWSDDDSD